MLARFIELVKKYQSDILLGVCVCLLTFTAYNLGKKQAFNSIKTPISISQPSGEGNIVRHETDAAGGGAADSKKADLSVVASSKSTSHLYHFKWCPGAGQISPANLLTFSNEAAAIAAGYKLASNCNK